jgi:hypothetical protein
VGKEATRFLEDFNSIDDMRTCKLIPQSSVLPGLCDGAHYGIIHPKTKDLAVSGAICHSLFILLVMCKLYKIFYSAQIGGCL